MIHHKDCGKDEEKVQIRSDKFSVQTFLPEGAERCCYSNAELKSLNARWQSFLFCLDFPVPAFQFSFPCPAWIRNKHLTFYFTACSLKKKNNRHTSELKSHTVTSINQRRKVAVKLKLSSLHYDPVLLTMSSVSKDWVKIHNTLWMASKAILAVAMLDCCYGVGSLPPSPWDGQLKPHHREEPFLSLPPLWSFRRSPVWGSQLGGGVGVPSRR